MQTTEGGSRGSYRTNLRMLRAAQKPSRGTAAYGRYVNRPAGRLLAAGLHVLGVTPNGATAVSALLSGTAILLIALEGPSWGPLIAVLLAAGYAFDSADGQLARLRGESSVRGEWLDHTVDCFKTSSIHLAVAIAWFRHPPTSHDVQLLVPLGFSVVQSVTYFGLILIPFLRPRHSPGAAESHENPLRKWLILPTDYGFLCWLFVLQPIPLWFATAYTIVFVLSAAMLALALRKWWRELGEIDAQRAQAP